MLRDKIRRVSEKKKKHFPQSDIQYPIISQMNQQFYIVLNV